MLVFILPLWLFLLSLFFSVYPVKLEYPKCLFLTFFSVNSFGSLILNSFGSLIFQIIQWKLWIYSFHRNMYFLPMYKIVCIISRGSWTLLHEDKFKDICFHTFQASSRRTFICHLVTMTPKSISHTQTSLLLSSTASRSSLSAEHVYSWGALSLPWVCSSSHVPMGDCIIRLADQATTQRASLASSLSLSPSNQWCLNGSKTYFFLHATVVIQATIIMHLDSYSSFLTGPLASWMNLSPTGYLLLHSS